MAQNRSLPGVGLRAHDYGTNYGVEYNEDNRVISAVLSQRVKSKTVDAPAITPALGDIYIVPVGATGDFLGQDNKLAVWDGEAGLEAWVFLDHTTSSWGFFVVDEAVNYQWNGASWTEFAGSGVTYLDRVLINQGVIDATLSTPPVSPTDGQAYIVAATATGDWLGQEDNIAIYETSAWVFYTPLEGYQVRDQTNDTNLQWDGASWSEVTAGTTPGPGFIERTYSDILSISAASSGEWIIPDNCIGITLTSHISCSASTTLTLALLKQSDGLNANFREASFQIDAEGTSGNATVNDNASISRIGAGVSTGASSGYVRSRIDHPRDSSIKTIAEGSINFDIGRPFRTHSSIAITAEDHDTVSISVSAGTMTGDIMISYTVLEANVGVNSETFTTSTAMTLSQAPAKIAMDHAGAETLTLPASAPVKTTVEVVQIGVGATTVAAPTGESLNGVTTGSASISAQYGTCICTKYPGDLWIISGDVGAVS